MIEESDSEEEQGYGITTFFSKWRGGKKRVRYELLELTDKVSGETLDFNVYQDCDLPFLNARESHLIKQNIIQGEVDDDCQTDDEQQEDAKTMLREAVKTAVNKFMQDKKDGTAEYNVKNLNLQKRYSRPPFNLPCTE